MPIRYVNQGYPYDVLAGVYRAARIGLVTPLRDEMNLVAKEYVAAQGADDPDALILSRFGVAAEQMHDALLVNPHSAEEIAEAILAALKMKKTERIRRRRILMDGIAPQDVVWASALHRCAARDGRGGSERIQRPRQISAAKEIKP